MLEIVIIGILGGLIYSYKPKKETYFTNFLKGILIGVLGYLISFMPDMVRGDIIFFHKELGALLLCLLIGAFVGLFFMLGFHLKE